MNTTDTLVLTSAFADGGTIPGKYTGFGENISPELHIGDLSPAAATLAVTMDDLDIPVIGRFNHWLIWNLPAAETIPENIPHGAQPAGPSGARQGIGYGKHAYRGPQQPPFVRRTHRYLFTVYALDCALNLPADTRKKALLRAMDGHILQQGSLLGIYQRPRRGRLD